MIDVALFDLKRGLAVALALLLVLAPAVGIGLVGEVAAQGQGQSTGGASPAHAGPPDHAGVPSSNVEVQGDGSGGPPDHAAAWGVASSAHSGDLSVTIEASSGLTITLTDDVNSDGREVSVNASAVEQALGERPQVAYGVNSESGERWSSEVRYEDGAAVISVPHFSTNTATFSGSVSVGGTFSDGESTTYSLSSNDSISNLSVNVTGTTATETDTATMSSSGDGTLSLSVEGNAEPSDASVTVENTGTSNTQNFFEDQGDGTQDGQRRIGDNADGTARNGEIKFVPSQDGKLSELVVQTNDYGSGNPPAFDIYVSEQFDGTYGQGTQVASGVSLPASTATTTIDITDISVSQGTTYAIEFVVPSINANGADDWAAIPVDNSPSTNHLSIDGSKKAMYPDVTTTTTAATATSVSVTGDSSVSFGDIAPGGSATATVPISLTTTSLDVTTGTGADLSVSADYTEKTTTVDPAVSINGNTTDYSGSLSDGSTVSLSADEAWLQSGTNTIDVSAGSGSLSADAPTPAVILDYSHTASDDISVEHDSTEWEESFNVSHTYANATDSASITASFDENVVKIEDAEYRIDGGAWSTLSDYSLDGTQFVANFASISDGSTVDVRVNGRKVQTFNGDITVVEATVEGDDLDTLIRVQNPSEGFRIDVSNTSSSDKLHYAGNPSYDARDYSVVGSQGSQVLHLPAANDGSEARIRTAPISLSPDGEIEAVVVNADEPRFSIREGETSGSSVVGVTYSDTVSGERYVLHSETRDRDIDADRAESPVHFQASGSDATYTILQEDSGGAAVVSIGDESGGQPLGIIALVGSISVGMLGLAYGGRRLGIRGSRSTLVLLLGGGVLGFIGVEAVTERSVLSDLVFAIGQVLGRTGGGFAQSGIGSIILSVGGLLGLRLLDRATGWVPTWLFWVSGAGLSIYSVESIAPGTLTSGLSEVSPLLWLLGAIAVVVFLWRRSAGPSIIVQGGDGDGS